LSSLASGECSRPPQALRGRANKQTVLFKEAGEERKGDGKEIQTSGLKPQTKIPGYITVAQGCRLLTGEAVSRAPSVERRVSAAPVSRAPQLIITNYLG